MVFRTIRKVDFACIGNFTDIAQRESAVAISMRSPTKIDG